MYDRYFSEKDRYINEVYFYQNIEQNQTLVEDFVPSPKPKNLLDELEDINFYILRYFKKNHDNRYTGPTIKIYEINH